jgi:COP9 signalosome complex subunit 4
LCTSTDKDRKLLDVDTGKPNRYIQSCCISKLTWSEIEGIQSQATKLTAYTTLLDQIYSNSSSPQVLAGNLTAFINAILAESVSLVITRPVLVDFVSRLDSIQDREAKKHVLTFALDKVHPRAVSFEEQAAAIREKLADIYEEEGDHKAAARALQGITLESGQRYTSLRIMLTRRTISADYKFSVYVRIMRNLLEEDEAIQAIQFLNRANLLIHETKNVEYILFFKLCQARILDATRKFLDAAGKYRTLFIPW